MNPMKAALCFALLAASVCATPATDRNFATRVEADLQSAGPQSLPDLDWQQGTTPRLSIDQYAAGKAITADTGTTTRAVLIFGPSATSAYFVAVTNYAASGNGYLIDVPTVGTNTPAAGWWYTCYLEQSGSGKRFWTGNGRLDITATTSTADGLQWQSLTTSAQVTAEAALRASGDAALLASNTLARAATATHAARTDNPHAVTAAQVGAASMATVSNQFLRVIEVTPGVWQHKLPGE